MKSWEHLQISFPGSIIHRENIVELLKSRVLLRYPWFFHSLVLLFIVDAFFKCGNVRRALKERKQGEFQILTWPCPDFEDSWFISNF